jgi:hypothetical protein
LRKKLKIVEKNQSPKESLSGKNSLKHAKKTEGIFYKKEKDLLAGKQSNQKDISNMKLVIKV